MRNPLPTSTKSRERVLNYGNFTMKPAILSVVLVFEQYGKKKCHY